MWVSEEYYFNFHTDSPSKAPPSKLQPETRSLARPRVLQYNPLLTILLAHSEPKDTPYLMILSLRPSHILWYLPLTLLIIIILIGCSEDKTPWQLHTEQGTTMMEQGKFPEAEQELEAALELAEQFEGQDPRLTQSITNLAILHNAKGEPEQAETLLLKAVAIHEEGPNPQTAELAASLSNLGALYVTQQKFDQAQASFERALAVREQALGPDNPEVIRDLENLAALFVRQAHYAQAEPYLKRVLDSRERTTGQEAPELIEPLNNLALLHRAQEQYDQAEALLLRAFAIKEK